MGFRLECGRLVSSSTKTVYEVDESFHRVLKTVSDDPVPQPLVMLGILTEQLVPVGEDIDEHISIITENIDETPTVTVSVGTVRGVMWLLSEVRESLDGERKQIIGELVAEANLNSAAVADTSTEQCQSEGPELTKKSKESSTVDNSSTSDVDSTDVSDSDSDDTSDRDSDNTSDGGSDDTSDIDTGDTPDENITSKPSVNNTNSNTKYSTTSDTGRIFECGFCTETFEHRDNLTSHSIQCEERPKGSRFQCQHCTNSYVSEQALSKHLESCKEKTRDANNSSKNSTNSNYRCSECGKTFDSSQQLVKHKRSHTGLESQPHPSPKSETTAAKHEATGTVVHFNAEDGYGFIKTYDVTQGSKFDSDSSEDVFFHVSEYPSGKATKGEHVQFNIKKTKQGYNAINISHSNSKKSESWDGTFASLRPRWGKDS